MTIFRNKSILRNKTILRNKSIFRIIFKSGKPLFFLLEKVVKRSAKFFVTELIPYVQLLIKERTNKEAKQIQDIEANFISSLS